MHTHPCSEASDVYSLAYMMEELMGLEECSSHPLTAALISWTEAAMCRDPAGRPTLAALVQVLEELHQEALETSPPRASEQDDDVHRDEAPCDEKKSQEQHSS